MDREPLVLLVAGLGLLTISGLHPHDRFTWFLELTPILMALPILVATYPLTLSRTHDRQLARLP